jgi:hypothetical protein
MTMQVSSMAGQTGASLKTYCGSDCTTKAVIDSSTDATTTSAIALPKMLSLGSSSRRQRRTRSGMRASGSAGTGGAAAAGGGGGSGGGCWPMLLLGVAEALPSASRSDCNSTSSERFMTLLR